MPVASALIRSQALDEWVDTVAEELDTTDREFAHRALWSWLQMMRKRLSARSAADFAAELPRSVRLMFLDERGCGAHAVKRGTAACTIRVARSAGIAVQDVRAVSSSVTAAMMRLLPQASVEKVLGELDADLQALVRARATDRAA
jgi:uncharacterized protein (DUF2267 family)